MYAWKSILDYIFYRRGPTGSFGMKENTKVTPKILYLWVFVICLFVHLPDVVLSWSSLHESRKYKESEALAYAG